MIWKIYCQIWYHAQWFVKNKYLRRPFTFFMRDVVHQKPFIGIPFIIMAGAGLAYLVYLNIFWILLNAFFWLLVGHVTWAGYTPSEQENPPYVEDETEEYL